MLQISSVSGLISFPFMGAYCASKHAVEALSDAWRVELKKFGIQVVLIEPGPIATPIWNKSINESAVLDQKKEIVEEYQPELNRFLGHVKKEAERAIPVERVSELVGKVSKLKQAKARYTINGSRTLLRTLNLLPETLVDRFIRS